MTRSLPLSFSRRPAGPDPKLGPKLGLKLGPNLGLTRRWPLGLTLGLTLGLISGLSGAAARAEVPRVATDIAPVHALTAQVMAGLGQPDLIVEAGGSPHGYALRPSQARALQSADLVIWIGPELTPWLEKPLSSLAGQARVLALLPAEATARLAYRDTEEAAEQGEGDRDAHAHGHDQGQDRSHEESHGDGHADGHEDGHAEGHEDGHADGHADGHEDGHGEGHAEHAGHAGRDDENHGDGLDHGHDHEGGTDPHAWLDPENARRWLDLIADELARIDPENAATYRANAARAEAELAALQAEIAAQMAPLSEMRFLVFHDAYQYFERRFGLQLAGTVARGDAAAPGPARLARLRDRLATERIACAFSEPQLSDSLLTPVIEGQGIPVLLLDPLGANLDPGPGLYAGLLRAMAGSFAACGR